MTRNTKTAADELELYITTSDQATLAAFDFAFLEASKAVDQAAEVLAETRGAWHDDPLGDPKGFAEHHAPPLEQFDTEARAAVVMALFERCERVRQENIVNKPTTTPSTFAPRPELLDLSPRTVVRFDSGKRNDIEGVIPMPFDAARAEEIHAAAPGYNDDVFQQMTDGEIAYVHALWDTIPDGRASFNTTLNAIRKGT